MPISVETYDSSMSDDAARDMTAVASRPAQIVESVLAEAFVPPGATLVRALYSTQTATMQTQIPNDEPATAADRAVADLVRFAALDSNWDGNNAARPIGQSLLEARHFIRSLSPESIIPSAALHADGHAVLLLQKGNAYAELEFLGEKRIGFYARRDGQEWGEEFVFTGGGLPEGLSVVGLSIGS